MATENYDELRGKYNEIYGKYTECRVNLYKLSNEDQVSWCDEVKLNCQRLLQHFDLLDSCLNQLHGNAKNGIIINGEGFGIYILDGLKCNIATMRYCVDLLIKACDYTLENKIKLEEELKELEGELEYYKSLLYSKNKSNSSGRLILGAIDSIVKAGKDTFPSN